MEKSHLKKKLARNLIVLTSVVLIVTIGFFFIAEFRPKFKDLTIELGTDEVLASNFLTNEMFGTNAKILTDLTKINFSEVSEFDIKLLYNGKEETVKLKIVDSVAPVVEFQNITKNIGYKVSADDFIVTKEDLSEMIVTASPIKDTSEFKDYVVEVTVEDVYGNKTVKNCILTISWLKPLVLVELGSDFSKELIVENMEKDAAKISQTEIDKVNTMNAGEYILSGIYNNKTYESKVVVQDTVPPKLELQNVVSYAGREVTKENFIKSVADISGKVTTTLKQAIDYNAVGKKEVTIEAIDINGNKTEETATLTIIDDTVGPKISGLGDIYINKYASINYTYGVSAVDANDGTCKFSVDTSKVNTSAAGTYYATYTAKDQKGNLSTAKRKIVVKHDQADTDYKFNVFYNNYLAGKDALEMATVIRSHFSYNHNWGGDDPVWYGLTYNAGNCYVHALLFQKALTKAGITNQLIHVIDKSHYWNLVYMDGKWRHYDTTPGSHIIGPATDDEKYNSDAMRERDWDRDAYPVAN